MKNFLRNNAKNQRKAVHNAEKDLKIINNLKKIKEYKKSRNIILYYPLKYEINVLNCLKDTNKNFFLPRVKGEELEICSYECNSLKKGKFNIIEPCNEEIRDLSIIDAIIIPALAIDRKGYRLGYGKGYYDRLLKKLSCNKVVLIYEQLIFDTIYPESCDEKCNIAVCEDYTLVF